MAWLQLVILAMPPFFTFKFAAAAPPLAAPLLKA
jgi:hypothetical protein